MQHASIDPMLDSDERHVTSSMLATGARAIYLDRPIDLDDLDAGEPQSDERAGNHLASVLAACLPQSDAQQHKLRERLQAAGWNDPHALESLNAIRYAGIMLPILVGGLLLIVAAESAEPVILTLFAGLAVLGYFLPPWFVQYCAASRVARIRTALPIAFELVAHCLKSGMTISESLEAVGREVRAHCPEIDNEFRKVAIASRITSCRIALRDFSERMDWPEVRVFVANLLRADRWGTDVSSSLLTLSDQLRTR